MTSFDDRERAADEALRREGDAWRKARAGCPDADLLLAWRSEAIDPEVRDAVAAHLAGCDACARFAADVEALTLETVDEALVARVRTRLPPGPRRFTPARLGWAAVLLIGFVAGVAWWERRSPSEPQTVPHTEPRAPAVQPTSQPTVVALWTISAPAVDLPATALGPTRSGKADPQGTALLSALGGYRAGRPADSIAPLERIVSQDPTSRDAAFYLGVSYLLGDRPEAAVAPLEAARALGSRSDRAQADWFLATAEQRAGRTEASRARLTALCTGRSEYRALACDAVERLR